MHIIEKEKQKDCVYQNPNIKLDDVNKFYGYFTLLILLFAIFNLGVKYVTNFYSITISFNV